MFGNLGGALSPLVVGVSLERLGSWEAPLLSVAVLYVGAAIGWLAIDPTQAILTNEPGTTRAAPAASEALIP